MFSTSLFIAHRYLKDLKEEQTLTTMIKVAFFSIFITVFALSLVISIMLGFEQKTYEAFQSINPQITLQSNKNFLNFEQIKKVLLKEFLEIESFAPTDIQYTIIKNEINQSINNISIIKGIDPINEKKIINIEEKIKSQNNITLEEILKDNKIIIGEKLAKELNLNIGNEVTLLIPEYDSSKISFQKKNAIINGFINTGFDDFDSKIILTSLKFLFYIYPNIGITQISIKLKNNVDEKKTIQKLKNRFKLDVYSWKELYPAIDSALNLEKLIIFIIFSLVAFMAIMNIISLLFMIITYKKKDVAVFKSLGFPNILIKNIFLILGMTIVIPSTLIGLVLSYSLGLIIDKYKLINLPDIYYSKYLPIKLDFNIFIIIFLIFNIIGIFACLLTLRQLKYINITNILKSET